MKLGFIGLGKMGSRMVIKLLEEGHDVVVWNRTKVKIDDLQVKIQNSKFNSAGQNLKVAESIDDLISKLDGPRIVWLMLTAGDATESALSEVGQYVEKDDVVIEGGNSHYSDTQKRYEEFFKKGV